MKITIKNLGAVKNATIDLGKKLNVFCGRNSTGKTYMAYILYTITSLSNKSLGIELKQEYIDAILEKNEVEIPLDFKEMFEYKQKEDAKIKPNLWKLFAIPESKSDLFFKDTEIIFHESKEDFTTRIKNIKLNDDFKLNGFNFKIIKTKEDSVSIKLDGNTIKNIEFSIVFTRIFLMVLYSKLVYYPVMSSTIFPVERNSIFTFNKELSIKNNEKYDLIKQLSSDKDFNRFDLLFSSSNRYPQPIRDCLQVADDLENIKKTNSIYYDFALKIEKELLEGKIILGEEGNVEFSSNRASKKKTLSFHQSSSIVKTLAGLIIYLKHSAQKNDLIIIDEPELNLHPDNQIKLTRIIAQLINQGLNFVISTHSDYILREFNNLIMLSSDNEDIAAIKKDFKSDEYINKEDIDVHYFHYKSKRKADVDKITVTEYGFDIPSIDEEIEKQNKLTDGLYYTLKYGLES